ncbi:MAG TPA: hypothetical protein VLB44_11725 [Kofleriaceae bacterium]|nr:hypothetical protein [Kofleriaceae bacterium]
MRRVAFLVAVIALVTACGDDGVYDPSLYVTVDDYAAAYKDAECTYLARCGFFSDKATCLTAQLFTYLELDRDLVGAIKAGRVYYNGNAVKACFDAIAANTCDKTDEAGRVQPDTCRGFTRGTVAGGGSCTISSECISGDCRIQVADQMCAMGICMGDMPPSTDLPANGQSCSTVTGCTRGSFCDTATLICTTLRSAGDQCIQNSDCDYGLGCAGSPRTCQILPGPNEPCPAGACRDDGYWCDVGTCHPIGLVGGGCMTYEACSPYFPCDFATSMCHKPPSIGDGCTSPNTRCFEANSYCDGAMLKCVAAKPDGQSCTTSAQCLSVDCDPATSTCITETCFP